MMRAEREELLRRYLEGEMSLEQEHDFIIQAALDKELRHELKAQQTIDRAFRKDRVVDPSAYAPLQANVARMIAGISVAHPVVSETKETGPGRFFKGGTGRWVLGSLLCLALLAGLLTLILPDNDPAARLQVAKPAISLPAVQEGQQGDLPSAAGHFSGEEELQQEGSEEHSGLSSISSTRVNESRSTASTSSRSGEPRNVFSQSTMKGSLGEDTAALRNGTASQNSVQQSIDNLAAPTLPPAGNHVIQQADPAAQDSLTVGVRFRWKKK